MAHRFVSFILYFWFYRYGWIDVAKKLLQSRDFRQVDIANDYDRTPLHCAAEEGHSNMVAVLLDYQASVTK